ncbi:PREDICTED: transmembrane protein 51 [Chaetura pelagica]|uniref:transmembrane protein 51 n=1 Tax=Chaetura pelagica TaxID=8897 RepID=UPI00052370D8|nr:PREDICTED: transmembrane protein 51 [Chaetura pelagica]
MAQSRANGSHYALTAIGLGMLVLGIIMAVWNLVPGFGPANRPSAGNSSKPDRGTGAVLKSKTFSVAYVLVGAGVVLLLLSICLNIRDKRRQSQDLAHGPHTVSAEPSQQEDSQEEDEDTSSQYYVPSYEEVMNTGYSEPRDSERSTRLSVSLPSYESLAGLEGSPAPGAAEPGPERQAGRHSSPPHKRPNQCLRWCKWCGDPSPGDKPSPGDP